MLIGRCAWHQRYCGYPLLNGVVSWRGWNVRFTDGICEVSSAQSGSVERGRTSTTIDAAVPAAVTLVVNGRFIVDALAVLGTDNAEIHPNSNSRAPFLLTAPDDADYRQFVMPVRVA